VRELRGRQQEVRVRRGDDDLPHVPLAPRPFALARAVGLALALALGGCTKGDECDRCDSDDDCREGWICGELTQVDGESVGKRCVSGVGDTECRVR
jgi:hypothetical protein